MRLFMKHTYCQESSMNLRALSIAFGATVLVNTAWAAGPDVCAALPVAKVNSITHQSLSGARPDISEEAHSYSCSYGSDAHVSVTVIHPGGSQAAARTMTRYPHATAIAGLGDRAFYDKSMGMIAVFGDTAIDAFVPPGKVSDAQLMEMEKSLVLAVQSKL
jgi:hypothetical protein